MCACQSVVVIYVKKEEPGKLDVYFKFWKDIKTLLFLHQKDHLLLGFATVGFNSFLSKIGQINNMCCISATQGSKRCKKVRFEYVYIVCTMLFVLVYGCVCL